MIQGGRPRHSETLRMGDIPQGVRSHCTSQEYHALLDLAEMIVSQRELPALFWDLAGRGRLRWQVRGSGR